ncbi:hypothetical protein M413DRAFT_444583 [Hebeloma cylindrosporum]|uniref:Uncharacterized protein n=1 Tax=Hebeloma cylindrosporum TaxID=76867 RepID=A0A0C2YMB1_HEBCY|nr:hypothetical protein M413DRAFT_444583 [Hebeloma cylindrosporum h7]
MFPSVNVDLHRWFDETENNKPMGWFWLPAEGDIVLLMRMHAAYVGDRILSTAGSSTNFRFDPENVCPCLLVLLEKCRPPSVLRRFLLCMDTREA